MCVPHFKVVQRYHFTLYCGPCQLIILVWALASTWKSTGTLYFALFKSIYGSEVDQLANFKLSHPGPDEIRTSYLLYRNAFLDTAKTPFSALDRFCDVTVWRHMTSYHVTSCDVMWCHVTSCDIMWHVIMPKYGIMWWHRKSWSSGAILYTTWGVGVGVRVGNKKGWWVAGKHSPIYCYVRSITYREVGEGGVPVGWSWVGWSGVPTSGVSGIIEVGRVGG